MDKELICYHKFRTYEEAEVFLEVLQNNNIAFQVINNNPRIDPVLAGSYYEPLVEIHIPPQKFEQADELMIHSLKVDIEQIEKNYYLLSFSDNELMEVLQKPDEWSKYDYVLATQLLKKRNVFISTDDLHLFKKERIETQAEPEKEGKHKVTIGYFFSLIGGFVGILIGYILWQSKKYYPTVVKYIHMTKKQEHTEKNILFRLGNFIATLYFQSIGVDLFPVFNASFLMKFHMIGD